jgi:hypothetical protein
MAENTIKSKKELLTYRMLRRTNKFNARIKKFVRVGNRLSERSFVVGKTQEDDCN